MRPSPRRPASWRPAPPPRSWWLGGCGRSMGRTCWQRPTPSTPACRAKQPRLHVQAMQQPGLGPAGAQPQPQPPPSPPSRPGMGGPDDWTARLGSPARSIAPPVDPHRLPSPRLGELDPADAAKLWALVSELPGSQFIPRSQLIRLTGVLPADLAARLLRLLDGGPELVGAQAARIRTAIDPSDPATPALAVVVLGWLEAAAQVLAAGSSPQELQVLLSVADRQD